MDGAGTVVDDRLTRAFAAIDAANADDPNTIVVDGRTRPKEQAHAELAVEWVQRLDPGADELALIAARAHHLRRWALPRSAYPEGRAGYLRWRAELKRRHADEVGVLLVECGYEPDEIARVQAIVRKEGLGRDPVVQVHEDALCLVFVQTQLADVAARLGDERTVEVVRKTIAKMSRRAVEVASSLPLSPAEQALLAAAAAPGDAG